MSFEQDGWGFTLYRSQTLRVEYFHNKLIEFLARTKPSEEAKFPPEAFSNAWKKGIGEYKRLYEKALDWGKPTSYDRCIDLLYSLCGYKNTHGSQSTFNINGKTYDFPLFLIGQTSLPKHKENLRRVKLGLITERGPLCQLCGKRFPKKSNRVVCEAHHIIPESFGGKAVAENLALLCEECHSSIKSPMEEAFADFSRSISQSKKAKAERAKGPVKGRTLKLRPS